MLNGLKVACMRNYELLAKYMRREFEENQIEQIHRVSFYINILFILCKVDFVDVFIPKTKRSCVPFLTITR